MKNVVKIDIRGDYFKVKLITITTVPVATMTMLC